MSSFYYTWSRYVCGAFRKDDEIGASLKDSPYKPITLVVCVCVCVLMTLLVAVERMSPPLQIFLPSDDRSWISLLQPKFSTRQ